MWYDCNIGTAGRVGCLETGKLWKCPLSMLNHNGDSVGVSKYRKINIFVMCIVIVVSNEVKAIYSPGKFACFATHFVFTLSGVLLWLLPLLLSTCQIGRWCYYSCVTTFWIVDIKNLVLVSGWLLVSWGDCY